MRWINILIMALFLTAPLFAQDEIKAKYGKIKDDDVRMKYYSRDSSAEAVLLYEEAEVSFSYDDLSGIKMIYNYFGRYKILKKSGLELGIIKIPLYQGSFDKREIIGNIDGCTYNWENGKVVSYKLTKASIFHEHIVDNNYQEKISMPNLVEGSVFEYRYRMETPFSVRYIPRTWYFQNTIPVQWSEYNITIPKNFNYRILKEGFLKFAVNTQGNIGMKLGDVETSATVNRMAVKYAPAFHVQKYVASIRDYMSRLEFDLTSVQVPNREIMNFSETWGNVAKTILKSEHYEETFKRTGFLSPIIQNLKTLKDTMQRIQGAFDYVAGTLEWDHTVSVFSQTDANKVFENKKGSATEINLILVSLLKALGFDANPLIISTRGNGGINERYPSLDQFNYTIVCVELNGKDILMDATDRFVKPGMLPERCLNRIGRLIKDESSRFVSLTPHVTSGSMEMITAIFNPTTGEISGSLVATSSGYHAHDFKESIKENGEANVIKDIKKQNSEWKIENVKIENSNGAADVRLMFDFVFPENVSAEIVYLNPMMSGAIKNNPFAEQGRIYPVDLITASDKVFIATIKIPQGYSIEDFPKPVNVELPDNLGKFTYTVAAVGDAIKITSRISINEYYFNPSEYDMLREFYDYIVQKHAEQLVIKKI